MKAGAGRHATVVLMLVALMWAGTFPVLKDAMQHEISAQSFVFWRFICAALVLLPFVWKRFHQLNRRLLKAAVVMALSNVVTQVFQNMGLQTSSSAEAAFIMGTYVLMVPLMMPLFRLGKPQPVDMLATCLCFFGLVLLTGVHFSGGFHVGYGYLFIAAFSIAGCINVLHRVSSGTEDMLLLTFMVILGTAFCVAFLAPYEIFHAYRALPSIWTNIAYTGVVATSLAQGLQNYYQRYVSADRAALIYAGEPIFAGIIAFYCYGEGIKENLFWGGGCVLCSFLLGPLYRLYREHLK